MFNITGIRAGSPENPDCNCPHCSRCHFAPLQADYQLGEQYGTVDMEELNQEGPPAQSFPGNLRAFIRWFNEAHMETSLASPPLIDRWDWASLASAFNSMIADPDTPGTAWNFNALPGEEFWDRKEPYIDYAQRQLEATK